MVVLTEFASRGSAHYNRAECQSLAQCLEFLGNWRDVWFAGPTCYFTFVSLLQLQLTGARPRRWLRVPFLGQVVSLIAIEPDYGVPGRLSVPIFGRPAGVSHAVGELSWFVLLALAFCLFDFRDPDVGTS